MMTKSITYRSVNFKYIIVLPAILLFLVISGALQIANAQNTNIKNMKLNTGKAVEKAINKGTENVPSVDMGKLSKLLVYPESAKKAGKEGKVVLNVKVSKTGKPLDIAVASSTDKVFEKPSIDAMKKMVFTPWKKNNIATPYGVTIPIQFKLK
jgi:TonB family protein